MLLEEGFAVVLVKPRSKWIAVTAGLLPENFEEAANRVERDLKGLYPFTKIINFTIQDFERCAPKTLEKYGDFLREDVAGYGYYSWKPEMVERVFSGEYGECDGVVWIDGGCEIFKSPWTRKIFENQIQAAEKSGYVVYDLETPESQFTKYDVFDYFPSVEKVDTRPQVQATHFFLYGEQGRKIAKTWVEAGLRGFHMFDQTPSKNGEIDGFVLHKSDQSLLSLTIKSMSLSERVNIPPAGNRGFLSRLKAMRAPVWVSRNRNGKSVKGTVVSRAELLMNWKINRSNSSSEDESEFR